MMDLRGGRVCQACLGIGQSARISVPNPLARNWAPNPMPNFVNKGMWPGGFS